MAFDVGAWDYAKWGASGYGDIDIDEAKNRGATAYNLWQLKDRADKEGVVVGPNTVGRLGERPDAPIDYGAHGYWGFGTKDMEHLGRDLEKIKEARQWAWDHGVQVGGDVTPWIQGKETENQLATIQQGNEDRLNEIKAGNEATQAIQTQAAADQQTLMQQLADQEATRWQAEADRNARVRSSAPTGVGGAASIRGSRLSITESGGRKGPKRFARPTQYMNTLGIRGGSSTQGQSTLNL